jgi:hypothetical protein
MQHLQIGWRTRVKMCCILHGPSCYHCRHVQNTVQYSPSIDIRPEWTVLEQVQVPLLTKLSLRVEEPNDYMQCGIVSYYEKKIDRVAPRSLVPLVKTNSVFRSVTASEDPILVQIAKERKARVFITDSILTALMCTPRSVYSWDIVITRKGDQLWFDKRPNSVLDKESVNETAPDGVPEDDSINGVAQLAMEATAVRQNFSQQCLDIAQSYDLGQPNPFATVCASLCVFVSPAVITCIALRFGSAPPDWMCLMLECVCDWWCRQSYLTHRITAQMLATQNGVQVLA